MSKINSEQIAKTRSLIAGLKQNVGLVKQKGLDEQFINKLESDNQLASTFNDECEQIREEFRIKTTKTRIKMNDVKSQVKEAKRIIKRDFDKSRWQEFGISDLR